jgi:hypothetical protein
VPHPLEQLKLQEKLLLLDGASSQGDEMTDQVQEIEQHVEALKSQLAEEQSKLARLANDKSADERIHAKADSQSS